MYLFVLAIRAGSEFPSYFGVVIFSMPKFDGTRAHTWLSLGSAQIREIVCIVSSFHEVNIEAQII